VNAGSSPARQVTYALLRITGTRDQESKTVKFVFICYVGPAVGGMVKGVSSQGPALWSSHQSSV
jgi:glycerol uptake facilitator-like aquaporin